MDIEPTGVPERFLRLSDIAQLTKEPAERDEGFAVPRLVSREFLDDGQGRVRSLHLAQQFRLEAHQLPGPGVITPRLVDDVERGRIVLPRVSEVGEIERGGPGPRIAYARCFRSFARRIKYLDRF